MTQENTIVFGYNPKGSIKAFFWVGLVMFLVPLLICFFRPIKELSMSGILTGGVFLILALWLWIKAIVMRQKQKNMPDIIVSPKGVITPKGELIPMNAIDHCFLKFHYDEQGALLAVFFNIRLKSGETNSFKFNDYIIPFAWTVEDFNKQANKICGIPLFKPSEIYRAPAPGRRGEMDE